MLQIGPLIAHADELANRIGTELPTHPGLLSTARLTADAARDAEQVSRRTRRLLGLHRLPAAFLLVAVAAFASWTWWHFFHTSTITIAISDTDAVDLGHQLDRRVQYVRVRTPGSRDNLARLERGDVDAAFVQGGVEIPPSLPRAALPTRELLLLFLRSGVDRPEQLSTILTSTEGQGSHTVAQRLVRIWGIEDRVHFRHDWSRVQSEAGFAIPDDVDAVLVVKDPLDERLGAATRSLSDAGFQLAPVDLGAAALGLPFLTPFTITPGYLSPMDRLPGEAVPGYLVSTYLVARPDLGPRQLAAARRLAEPDGARLDPGTTLGSVGETSEALQGLEAFLGILVYIGIAFIALLGLDVAMYRQRFHELNSLISLVSMHQAAKDVAGLDPATKAHHITYLSFCSDILGLISTITGYYAQENSSLLYNRMLEIIPQRCDGLKVNIQLKILHALIGAPPAGASRAPASGTAAGDEPHDASECG